VPEREAAVEEGLHLGGHVEEIDRGGEHDGVGRQQPLDDGRMVVGNPAPAAFQAVPAADAVLDPVVGEMDDLQAEAEALELGPDHRQHHARVPGTHVRRAVDGDDYGCLVHGRSLWRR